MRLESWYVPADTGPGSMRLRLVNDGAAALERFELTLTSVVQLDPVPPARLVSRISGCHVVAPPPGTVLGTGEVWELTATCGHRPGHANDGPASAHVSLADGRSIAVATGRTRRVTVGAAAPVTYRPAPTSDVAASASADVAARDERLHPYRPPVLRTTGEHEVAASLDPALPPDAFRVDVGPTITAGSPPAVEQALTRLVRAARTGGEVPVGLHAAAHGWRGLHVDLARQFLLASDVEWLVDVAVWHGLNRLHVHLTDDEAWRIPVPGFPALTDVGAWRGRGLAIPPLLGSGADPYGGAYAPADIAGWHVRAAGTGLVIVPEIDLPGHSFAAVAALPDLADPDDASTSVSVQHFRRNVLNPGVPATWSLLEAAFAELAAQFPSPWLHVGGDEVPTGAWDGSPLAQAWGASRGDIGLAFLGEIIALVRRTTGRRVGVWEEGAAALDPDDGYVVGWRSAGACRRLAAAGLAVVAAPAEVCYLDMAASAEWDEPGTSWAGSTSLADVEAFDPAAGWSAAERANLLGVQACLWTEHVQDRPTMEQLLFPRLTAFAERAWPCLPSPQ
jgi:hexosaminidase